MDWIKRHLKCLTKNNYKYSKATEEGTVQG
jgi:hypothetical protein